MRNWIAAFWKLISGTVIMADTTPTPIPAPTPIPLADLSLVILTVLNRILVVLDQIAGLHVSIETKVDVIGAKLMAFADSLASLSAVLPQLQADQKAMTAQLQTLQASVKSLQDQLAAGGGVTPAQLSELQQDLDSLAALHTANQATLNPPPPPPPPPMPPPPTT